MQTTISKSCSLKHLSTNTYIFPHTSSHIHLHTYLFTHTSSHIPLHTYLFTHISSHIPLYTCLFTHASLHTHLYTCSQLCTLIRTFIDGKQTSFNFVTSLFTHITHMYGVQEGKVTRGKSYRRAKLQGGKVTRGQSYKWQKKMVTHASSPPL